MRFEVTQVLDAIERHLTTDSALAQAVVDLGQVAWYSALDGGRPVSLLRVGLLVDALARHLGEDAVMIYAVASRDLLTDADLTSKERMVLGRWSGDGVIEVVPVIADRVPEVADIVATLRVLYDPSAGDALVRLLTGPRWRIGPRDLKILGDLARELDRWRGEGRDVVLLVGGPDGLDEALRRLAAWEDAGADVTMVLDISSEEEMRAIAAAARKPTVMLPMSVMLKKLSHLVTPEEAGKRGFSMVIHPSILLLAGVAAQRNVLRELAASGSVQGSLGAFAGFDEINALAGLPEFNEWSARFPTDAA